MKMLIERIQPYFEIVIFPQEMILDEPIAGLDPLGREDFLKLMTGLNRDGMTIIMVSHNADSLGEYADRILVFDDGRLTDDAAVKEVFADVEKMRSLSIGVSQSREIAYLLKKGGMDIPQDITAYRELLPAVIKALKGGESR